MSESPVEPASDHLRGRTPASLAQAAHEAASRLDARVGHDEVGSFFLNNLPSPRDVQVLVDHVLHTSDHGRMSNENIRVGGEPSKGDESNPTVTVAGYSTPVVLGWNVAAGQAWLLGWAFIDAAPVLAAGGDLMDVAPLFRMPEAQGTALLTVLGPSVHTV